MLLRTTAASTLDHRPTFLTYFPSGEAQDNHPSSLPVEMLSTRGTQY